MGLNPTFNGQRVTSARVNIPGWGAWWADVELDGEVDLSGAATLTIADASFIGTILAGGSTTTGRSFFHVVGGAAGWGKEIPKKDYANDAGIKVASVLSDAAQAAGESLDLTTVPAGFVGAAWARPADIAARVLERVSPGAWYVDVNGMTRIGRRKAVPLSIPVTRVTPIDKAAGTLTIATESIATILPGLQIDGLTVIDVEHEISAKNGLRSKLWGSREGDVGSRRLEALRSLLNQLDPLRQFRATWEYRVVTLSGNRVNLQAILSSSGMPDLQLVPVRPGVAGASNTLALGARVIVAFVNGDPGRPAIIGTEDPDGGGFKPVLTSIDAQTFVKLGAGLLPVARAGDMAGIFPIVTTQVKVVA